MVSRLLPRLPAWQQKRPQEDLAVRGISALSEGEGPSTEILRCGGRVSGGVKQAEALQQQSLFSYQQSILTALKEVEDALISTQKAREKLISDGHLVESLTEYARIARLRYDNGYTSFIEVLDSERSLFNAELTYVNTQNAVYVGLINTYKALGGGWVVLAEQRANEIDFPEDEDGYLPDPATAASYSESKPLNQ